MTPVQSLPSLHRNRAAKANDLPLKASTVWQALTTNKRRRPVYLLGRPSTLLFCAIYRLPD